MKLRLHGNSVRLRLMRSEVERFRETGLVEESVNFGGRETLIYRLRTRAESGPAQAGFGQGAVTVSVSPEEARKWAGSDEVGIYARSGALSISIEKDFRCLSRPPDEQPDAYPHPGRAFEKKS